MKYIRTKNNIYTDDNLYTVTNGYDGKFKAGDKILLTDKTVVKVEEKDIANTIEELCDRFVMKTLLTYYENTHLKDLLLEYDKLYCKEDINVYGAIWTDKGLIYVAKMNDKGELELL